MYALIASVCDASPAVIVTVIGIDGAKCGVVFNM